MRIWLDPDLLQARGLRWQTLAPQPRTVGFVFEVVLGASIAHRPYFDPLSGNWLGLAAATTLARPVATTAVAVSMGLSASTVRRHAADLVAAGLLAKDAAGLRPAPGFAADGRLAEIAADDTRALVRVVASLAGAAHAPAAKAIDAGLADLPADLVARPLLDFALRTMEGFVALYGDVTAGTIIATIIGANVEHITREPALARRFAGEHTPPPDSLREPVALRALARSIDFPFETVRRRVAALSEQGLVVATGLGVVVPTRVLQDARHLANNRRIEAHFDRMLNALTALADKSAP